MEKVLPVEARIGVFRFLNQQNNKQIQDQVAHSKVAPIIHSANDILSVFTKDVRAKVATGLFDQLYKASTTIDENISKNLIITDTLLQKCFSSQEIADHSEIIGNLTLSQDAKLYILKQVNTKLSNLISENHIQIKTVEKTQANQAFEITQTDSALSVELITLKNRQDILKTQITKGEKIEQELISLQQWITIEKKSILRKTKTIPKHSLNYSSSKKRLEIG